MSESKIPSEALLADLQRVSENLGHSPSKKEYNEYGEYTSQTVINRFGTWNAGKQEAGLETTGRGQSSLASDDLLTDLKRVTEDLGHSPSMPEYEKHGKYSTQAIQTHFGSWNAGKQEAGLETTGRGQRQLSSDELLTDLRRVAEDLGHSPSMPEYNEYGEYTSQTVHNRFGSWNAGKQEAGLETVAGPSPRQLASDDLVADLQRVAEGLGHSPTYSEYNEHGEYSSQTVSNHFGTWNAGKREAGLETTNGGGEERIEGEFET